MTDHETIQASLCASLSLGASCYEEGSLGAGTYYFKLYQKPAEECVCVFPLQLLAGIQARSAP